MCQAVTTVRELFSPQFPFLQRVRSEKGVSLAMFKVDKPCIWETLQTCCEEDCLVADAAVLRLPGIIQSLPGISLPSIELLQCWKKSICPIVQCHCQCLGKEFVKLSRSQQSTVQERPRMQVSSSDHCQKAILSTIPIFANGQIKEQFLLSNVENCGKLRKLEFGRHLRPCAGKSLGCWCCCVNASRNPVATGNHVAEYWTFAMLKEWTLALRPSFNVLPLLLIDRTFVQQSSSYRPPVLKNHSLHSFHFCKGSDQGTVSPWQCWKLWKAEKAWAWQTPETLCWEESWLLMLLC